MKKIVFVFILVVSIILIIIITNSYNNTKFQIPNNVDIDISGAQMNGMVKNQLDKDLLINFINSLNLVEKKVKFPNESADVYIKIFNKNTLIADIRFYGGGIVYDYINNKRYVIEVEKQFELFKMLEEMSWHNKSMGWQTDISRLQIETYLFLLFHF